MGIRESFNVVERNIVVIDGKEGVSHLLNLDDDLFMTSEDDSTMIAEFKLLIELLNTIPNNDEEIIDRPYKIILPDGKGGLATRCYIDWIRTKKGIISGNEFSDEAIALIKTILDLMSKKYFNVELVPESYADTVEEKNLIEKVKNAIITENIIYYDVEDFFNDYGYYPQDNSTKIENESVNNNYACDDDYDYEDYDYDYDYDYDDDIWLGDGGYSHYRLTGEYPEDGVDEDFMIAAAIANRLD